MFAGQVMAGGSQSFTVTVNVHVAVFPDVSVAVHVTVVTPTGKAVPDAGTQLTLAEQLSVTVATNVCTELHNPVSLQTVMLPGHVITGSSVSFTVTVNEQLAGGFTPSSAVHMTVVVPTGKLVPEDGEHENNVGHSSTTVGA
jgi:hypothetical protein